MTLAMVVAESATVGLPARQERQAAVMEALSTLGRVFASSADPVLPSVLTALVALTVAQVLSAAPRLLLLVARGAGGLALSWVALAALALIDASERDLADIAGAAAIGALCLTLAMVVSEFNPFARRRRLQFVKANLSSARHNLRAIDDNFLSRRPLRNSISGPLPVSKHLALRLSYVIGSIIIPGVAAGLTAFVAFGDLGWILPALAIGTVYATLPTLVIIGGVAVSWTALRFPTARLTCTIISAAVLCGWLWLTISSAAAPTAPIYWAAYVALCLLALSALLPLFVRVPQEGLTIGGSLAVVAKADATQRVRRFKEERRFVRKQLKLDPASTARE